MDRLSELPDSIIFHIFWLLPMPDVVRTTILSKRWENLWTTTPFLNFAVSVMRFRTIEKLRNFVNRALLHWNGLRVLKFKVDLWDEDSRTGVRDIIDLWVYFAKKYEVEELYLHFENTDRLDSFSQRLYSCSSLKELSIKNGCFKINGNVEWNQLKCLTIIDGFGVSQHVINQMLSGMFRVKRVMPIGVLLASQKLLRMPRSSVAVQFIFCEY